MKDVAKKPLNPGQQLDQETLYAARSQTADESNKTELDLQAASIQSAGK
jgi:hypothetical protein